VWSKVGNDHDDTETFNLKLDLPTDPERSRRRDAFQSFGRGGIGNIRRSSLSRRVCPTHTRGREPEVFSVGRGGAGNIRSHLRDAQPITKDAAEAEYEAKVVRKHAEATTIHSSGRGGAGNIRSRFRGPAAVMHAHHEGIHSTG